MNIRWIVLKILDNIEFEGVFVHDALEEQTEGLELSKQERGFIKKVVFGVLENRIYLDYVIDRFSSVKVRKMKPAVRHTMRLSVYQLLFMENIPQSAVCDEAVKLIKKRKMFRLTGFVNGVLRTIIREKESIVLPDEKASPIDYLSVRYSCDKSLIEGLLKDYSYEQVTAFLEVSNEEAPLTIRVHHQKGTRKQLIESLEGEGIVVSAGKWLEDALHIRGIDRISSIGAFIDGRFQVQDESSMLVAEIGYEEGMKRILDVCSAPGGKATHLADKMNNKGQVKAFDISEKKTTLIKENVSRLGLNNVQTFVQDAAVEDPELVEWADLLVADVPCSGLGIIRKKPDIKWHISMDRIQELVQLQRSILDNVKSYVKVGGTLVYSTCTVTGAENEENIRWFLDNNPNYKLVPIEGPYSDSTTGIVRLMPEHDGPDGFFIAKMKRVK